MELTLEEARERELEQDENLRDGQMLSHWAGPMIANDNELLGFYKHGLTKRPKFLIGDHELYGRN